MSSTRRTFLKRGLLGSTLLAAGGGAFFALRPSDLGRAPRAALHVLDAKTFAVMAAVIERVVTAPDVDAIEIAHRVDVALRYLPVEGQKELKSALGLLENGLAGLLTRGSGTPFTRLSPEGRDAALHAWASSRVTLLRSAFDALRKLSLASYYASLEAGRAIGYAGPPFDKPDPGPISSRGALSPPFVPTPAEPHVEEGATP